MPQLHKLKDFKDEINKCSKCGLCQSVCPIFKETGNECAVSKGKFVMLDGVLKGDLKLNKNINKYLDLCLKCGKCTDFCPSGIDVCKIFETAKYEYAKKTFFGKLIFFLESVLIKAVKRLGVLEGRKFGGQEVKLVNESSLRETLQAQKSDKNHSTFQPFNPSTGIPPLPNPPPRGGDDNPSTKLSLLYFPGCVGNIFPCTRKLLKKIPNIEVIERDFDCCGIPFLSSGNLERYEEVKNHNLSLMDCDFDYILTDCASCESTLKNYFECSTKFISIGELLVKQNVKFQSEKQIKVTFHKPCHLKNTDFIKPLFGNCENVEYIEMDGFDDCCGFAGEFALKNHKISKSISDKKALNIIATGADYVITCCPSCILGLKQGLFGKKCAPKVVSLGEFFLSEL